MSTLGDILSTSEGVQYIGDISSSMSGDIMSHWGYHDLCGGTHCYKSYI